MGSSSVTVTQRINFYVFNFNCFTSYPVSTYLFYNEHVLMLMTCILHPLYQYIDHDHILSLSYIIIIIFIIISSSVIIISGQSPLLVTVWRVHEMNSNFTVPPTRAQCCIYDTIKLVENINYKELRQSRLMSLREALQSRTDFVI